MRIRIFLREIKEKIYMKIAWFLPKEFIKWCFIRVVANASTGKHSGQIVPELTAMDALERFE